MNSPREKAVWRSAETNLPDWPALAARAVDDLSRIAEAEIRLFEVGLRDALKDEIDRILKLIVALAAIGYGVLCVFAAVILLLHQLLHHWWMAFALAGALLLIAGIALVLTLARRREPVHAPSPASP
ncbi:MAG: phage holin family protein [Candidatus Binataceae bacterium]